MNINVKLLPINILRTPIFSILKVKFKAMKRILPVIVLFSLTFSLNAQQTGQLVSYNNAADNGVTDALYLYALGSIDDAKKKSTYSSENIEGSPYLSNDFAQAPIYYGSENAGTLFYRYNAYNEEIEIKQQNLAEEAIKALGRDKKIKIIVNGKAMSFKTFIDKTGKTQNGYLTLLQDGDYKLYKRLNVTFKEGKKAENTFVKNTPARFSQFEEYYLEAEGSNKIEEIELSNKKLLNLISGNQQSALKDFMKENKIKLKDENDLYTVFQFLNK